MTYNSKHIQRIRNMACPAIKVLVCVCVLSACLLQSESLTALWEVVFCWKLLVFIKLLCVILKAGGQPSWALSWLAYRKIHCIKVPKVQKVVVIGRSGINHSEYRWQQEKTSCGQCALCEIQLCHTQKLVPSWTGKCFGSGCSSHPCFSSSLRCNHKSK